MNRTNALAVGDAGRMGFTDVRTYMYAVIFLLGNIMLPQLCHLVPGAGATWLPIYFFTLVGAYLMGWRVGCLQQWPPRWLIPLFSACPHRNCCRS